MGKVLVLSNLDHNAQRFAANTLAEIEDKYIPQLVKDGIVKVVEDATAASPTQAAPAQQPQPAAAQPEANTTEQAQAVPVKTQAKG